MEAARIPRVEFDLHRLSNGLTMVLHRDEESPVAAIVVMYHVGSKNEKPGKTGLAHLFEHMMFKGSKHVADGEHFRLLQEIGANVNGTTSEDRTNYYETVPANSLELAFHLESDRMGFLLDALTQEKLDNQRDVVRNERRQNYDNQPYGTAEEKIAKALFPEGHPYSWPVIGSMEDLSTASLDGVKEFFRMYYAPNNACVAVAGNFEPDQTRAWIADYFGTLPAGGEVPRPVPRPFRLPEKRQIVFEDRVRLPRFYLAWPGPRMNTRDDAILDIITTILGSGKTSRLYRSLVYERQIAQSVLAYQDGMEIAGLTGIEVTAKADVPLSEIEDGIASEIEKILSRNITGNELLGAIYRYETDLVFRRSTALGKANALATYLTLTGDAENFNREFERYGAITPEEVRETASRYLSGPNVTLSIVPQGESDPVVGGEPQ